MALYLAMICTVLIWKLKDKKIKFFKTQHQASKWILYPLFEKSNNPNLFFKKIKIFNKQERKKGTLVQQAPP